MRLQIPTLLSGAAQSHPCEAVINVSWPTLSSEMLATLPFLDATTLIWGTYLSQWLNNIQGTSFESIITSSTNRIAKATDSYATFIVDIQMLTCVMFQLWQTELATLQYLSILLSFVDSIQKCIVFWSCSILMLICSFLVTSIASSFLEKLNASKSHHVHFIRQYSQRFSRQALLFVIEKHFTHGREGLPHGLCAFITTFGTVEGPKEKLTINCATFTVDAIMSTCAACRC